MTMADIARHAEVSRATLYRRWPNVQAVVAALMTREWTTALMSAFQPDAVDGRTRLVEGVVEVVAQDPRAPADAQDHRARSRVPHAVPAGAPRQQHGRSSRAGGGGHQGRAVGRLDPGGDPVWLARQIILVALASAVSGPVMAAKDEYPKLDEQLRDMLTRYLQP